MDATKETSGETASDTDASDSPAGGAGWKRFNRKQILMAAAALAALLLMTAIAVGVVVRKTKANAIQAAKTEASRKKAEEEAVARAENLAAGKLAHRAHQEIIEESLPASALPPPVAIPAASPSPSPSPSPALAAKDKKTEAAPAPTAPEKTKEAMVTPAPAEPAAPRGKTVKDRTPAPATAAGGSEAGKESGKEASKETKSSGNSAAGSCTLSGGNAASYGEALGKCLKEFNRLDGRE